MTFIVAEIGVNWDGDYAIVEEIMKKSKEVGCNAVKFQSFNENMVDSHPEKLRLMRSSITENNVERIDKIAKNIGIEWFCTPMYADAVDILNPYVKKFKIRVSDGKPLLENKTSDLIERVLDTRKEVFVSTQTSPRETKFYNNPKIKWLYCVPKYPCDLQDLDFVHIKDFNGYSNHCPNFVAPLTAAILGAEIIEIHITSDKKKNFIDNNISFDYNELDFLVNSIHASDKIKR